MKINTYSGKVPNIQEVSLDVESLHVWLDQKNEIVIERGDKIKDVIEAVTPYLSNYLDDTQIKKLVSYWFVIAQKEMEGRINQSWKPREKKYDPNRRYLQ